MALNDQIDIVQDSIVEKGVAIIKEDNTSYLSKLDDIQAVPDCDIGDRHVCWKIRAA